MAIDIEHFIPLEESKRITGSIMRALQGSRKSPGEGECSASARIYMAGEKEYEAEKRVREQGAPVNPNLCQELQAMRDELGVEGYEEYF